MPVLLLVSVVLLTVVLCVAYEVGRLEALVSELLGAVLLLVRVV